LARACAQTLAAAALAAGPGIAQAQEPGLEEVIVTATRRAENTMNVPVSVTALEGERMEALFEGGEDIRALATRVPSLYAESSNGRLAPRFYIRGLGNTDFDLAASQPVSVIVDEVVLENVILKSSPLFDIQRVEVRINQPLSSPFHQRRKTQPQYASIIILTQLKLFWHTGANDPPPIASPGSSSGAKQPADRLPAGGSTRCVSKPAVPGVCELSFPGVRASSALPQRRVGHYVPDTSGNRTLRNVR